MTLAALERRILQSVAACFAPEVMSEGKSMSPWGLALKVGRVAASLVWFIIFLSGRRTGAKSPGWEVLESDGPYARGQCTDEAEGLQSLRFGAGL